MNDLSKHSEKLTDIIASCIKYSAVHLPDDVTRRLCEMKRRESSPLAASFYDAMEKNLKLAAELDRPCCQDTGIIQFFAEAGTDFPYNGILCDCLNDAVRRATEQTPLRPNCVDIFGESGSVNTGTNTGPGVPVIDISMRPGRDDLTLYTYMAGGGCSLPGAAAVFPPLDGMKRSVEFIFDRVAQYGPNACPPLYVGVGFGGSADVASKLSKKALLRRIGERNANPRVAELEEELEEGLNALGIGPGGVTGRESVMGVSVEYAGRHPASFAVGLSVSCWVHRRSCLHITGDLCAKLLSHGGISL